MTRAYSMDVQKTLKHSCRFRGVGLHSGLHATLVLEPAGEHHGIRFVRGDLAGATPVPATIDHVADTRLFTSIACGAWRVDTVEHLLAAFCGCGIDNVEVVVHGPEVPILDGSAWPFVEAFDAVGVAELGAKRRYYRLRTSLSVRRGDSYVTATPSRGSTWACTIQFDHPLIGTRHREVGLESFRDTVARARTFGVVDDVKAMRKRGLARGGSLENALVMGEGGWLNPWMVRYEDEPVRHKLLDMMGDTMLLGARLEARIEAFRPGHALTRSLIRELAAGG